MGCTLAPLIYGNSRICGETDLARIAPQDIIGCMNGPFWSRLQDDAQPSSSEADPPTPTSWLLSPAGEGLRALGLEGRRPSSPEARAGELESLRAAGLETAPGLQGWLVFHILHSDPEPSSECRDLIHHEAQYYPMVYS